MENLDLKEIRNKLDEIDTQLVGLFEKRMALCSDVAAVWSADPPWTGFGNRFYHDRFP